MSLAVTLSRAQEGIAAPQVMVEVHLSGGLPATNIVGLPEAAVREARDRVRVAIQNTAFEYPNRRVTVNLAPAELPKDGGRFDLSIALGILAASGQVPREKLDDCEFLGELALTGSLRSVSGCCQRCCARARGVAGWWYHAKMPPRLRWCRMWMCEWRIRWPRYVAGCVARRSCRRRSAFPAMGVLTVARI